MNLISREDLHGRLEGREELKLVMTLSAFAYGTKHIPGSLHFETVDAALAELDRDDEIVVYCADAHCAASIYAYRLLEREGYRRVSRYAGGIADWEDAGYPLARQTHEAVEAAPAYTPARSRRGRPWWAAACVAR
jgi:rhodanese-related sulfurtransferase